ncbi:hypothetical protein [Streptomyces sp. NRRL S-1813]|uniref:hypothetical protein n=1 Tax=Streptomyces sp. NRRL S-1813 TaxID=1463888 RepID=UPI0004C80EC7|nr:hypothetical protein [Streptomyces sp. NRRL S-1813]
MFAHGILTWGDGTRYGGAAQLPLAGRHRLLLRDRRGHGRGPDAAHSGYEADADDLIRLRHPPPAGHATAHGRAPGGAAAP